MATPNEGKSLGFTLKLYDKQAKSYRPVYIAPDATDKIQGDVILSDSVTSAANASTGMTAATPYAVKTANDNANNRLSKISTESQNVASTVTFQTDSTKPITTINTAESIITASEFKGKLTGNADTATAASKLDHSVSITIKTGDSYSVSKSSTLDSSSSSLVFDITKIAASRIQSGSGTLPLDVIPQGAIEKLISFTTQAEALKAYKEYLAASSTTTQPFQIGDSIQTTGDKVMYIVTSLPKADTADGDYSWMTEYSSGSAVRLASKNIGSTTNPVFFNDSGQPEECGESLDVNISGTAHYAHILTDGQDAPYDFYNQFPTTFFNGAPKEMPEIVAKNDYASRYSTILVSPDAFESTDLGSLSLKTTLAGINVGNTGKPTYFYYGEPQECGDTLDVSITGNAETATKAVSADTAINADSATKADGALKLINSSGTGLTVEAPVYFKNGIPTAMYYVRVDNSGKATYSSYLTEPSWSSWDPGDITYVNRGSENVPVYFKNGVPQECTSIESAEYANVATLIGTSADTDNLSTIGTTSTPVYVNQGVISPCTSIGTVYVGDTQPTNTNVSIWIQPNE